MPAARKDEGSALDLHRRLVRHPAATFFMIADAQVPLAGIRRGDILVVDRALVPRDDDVVIAVSDGELRVWPRSRLPPAAALWGVVRALARELRP